MKALAISRNGQKVGVIGTPKSGGVMVTVGCTVSDFLPQDLLQMLLIRVSTDGESDSWPETSLSLGDEITIRIVDVESDDPPPKRAPLRPKRPPHRENRGDDFDFDSRFGRFK